MKNGQLAPGLSDDDLLVAGDDAPAPALLSADPRLARLTEAAKAYARAARSETPRAPMIPIGGSSPPGCGARVLTKLPPEP